MKEIRNQINHREKVILILIFSLAVSCKKFVTVEPPRTEPTTVTVFDSDEKAMGALIGIYTSLLTGFASGDITSITYLAAASSDELIPASGSVTDFFNNDIPPDNFAVGGLWEDMYRKIFLTNSLIEGLTASAKLTPSLKQQLLAEARFIRAFTYFYLINLFGDVPLVLTTDYVTNATIPRTSKEIVYDHIVKDLKEAKAVLPEYYPRNERVHANKWVATALLARIYLYRGQWNDAETAATEIINNSAVFSLVPLNGVFLANSREAIWQLFRDDGNSKDAATFTISDVNPDYATLRYSVVASFDAADQRRTEWIDTATPGNNNVYYPVKYKETVTAPIKEYSTIFRLAEQYLIRAEARLRQHNMTGATEDINVIRNRAGLSDTTADTQEEMQSVLENERLCELFTEWGHRWFDLKRWPGLITAGNSRADDLLPPLKKDWQHTDRLYPIPKAQIDKDRAVTQNPGYSN